MSRGRLFRFSAFFLFSAFISYAGPFQALHCYDCFEPHGWPFTYWHDGGFAGGAAWVPKGVAGDLAVCMGFSIVGSMIWGWMVARAKRESQS